MRTRPATLLLGIALAAAALAAGACGDGATNGNGNGNANANRPATSIVPPGPVDPDAPQTVSFTTENGVTITGDLYLPDLADGKKQGPALIALHQFDANRGTYKEFAQAMRKEGFTVLAIDGPGFGESTEGTDGKVQPDWDLTQAIDGAIDQLQSQPAVDGLRIGIVGASYGASNALIYAANHPADIRAAALLSVGANYHNTLPTEPALKKYGDRPLLMVAAKDDAESAADTEKLAASVKNPKYETKIYDAGGHGTALLAPSVGGLELLKAFFVKTLTGPIVTHDTAVTGGEGSGTAFVEGNENGNAPKEPKGKPR